ncbi:hypothetical protein [Aliikangiella sp. IMCC44359]|uniref:hypothetical protein n=1 Tax=Aliikangiella sp. IMCC44359 TaxID=3459125 RepID=UPI00403AD9D4
MLEWFESFSNPAFMPHGHCYLWRPDILWTHVLSDLLIGLSYYLIPIIMVILLYKRKQTLPYPDIFALFIAFIFFCGTVHLFSIYVTWFPAYEYQGWIKALTAFTSVLTVIVLVPKLPLLISLPGIEEAYKNSQNKVKELHQKQEEMRSMFSITLDREERIIELKKEVNQLMIKQNKAPPYDI